MDRADDSSGIIDDQGRLFGYINIIDALVVLLVLAVVAAGAALVFQSEPEPDPGPELATTNATLDLGTQPDYIVEALNEGDTYSPESNTNITITDVHLAPQDGNSQVVVRARLRGPVEDETISYGDAPPRLGRTLQIQTDTYQLSGTIRAIGSGSELQTTDTDVVVRTSVSASTASALGAGEEIRVGDRTVGTVQDVAVYETGNPDTQLAYLHTTLDTYVNGDTAYFGDTPVREGATVALPSAQSTLNAEIQDVGSGFTVGSTEVLTTDTVDADTAAEISVGDSYRVAGREIATVENVDVYGTQNPDRKRVAVGLRLSTLDHTETPQFGSTTVQPGATVPFRTDAYNLSGEIHRVGTTEQQGQDATRTVTLQLRDVPPALAESVESGMAEQGGNETIARITSVDRENASVVLTSDSGQIYQRDHPVNQDLTITAELSVRETTGGITFKGQTIQQGSTVTLDLGGVTIRPTVVSL